MFNHSIHHGRAIVRDYHSKKFWGKVKSFFTVAFWKGAIGLSVVLFFTAGLFSANVLLTHLV